MLVPEMFVPAAREFHRELRNHLHHEAELLEILVLRLRVSPDEELRYYADEIEKMAARLRKIAGE